MTTKTRGKRGRPKKADSPESAPNVSTTPETGRLDSLAADYEQAASETPSAESGTEPVASGTATTPAPAPGMEGPKKRGRKPKVVVAPNSEMFVLRPMVKGVIMFPYAVAAKKYGDHWALSDGEAETMVDPHMALLNKYLPDYVKQHSELYAVLMLHGMALLTRLMIQQGLNNEAAARAKESESVSNRDGVGEAGLREVFSTPRPATPAT